MIEATPNCPDCVASPASVRPIRYGKPSEAGLAEAMRGEVVLGGCLVDATNPHWACVSCGARFA